jgi:ORF6N domain-containing protein
MPDESLPVPGIDAAWIEQRIFVLRGQKIMLDVDLATLYGVPTKRLNEQVRRNLARFPDDFLFRLTSAELEIVGPPRSQNATLDAQVSGARARPGRGRNVKYAPYAFTEHGVTMLSAVLKSPRAVAVSIAVVRAFVRLRHAAAEHADLVHRIDDLEQRSTYHDGQLTLLFDTVHQLLAPDPGPDNHSAIGFLPAGSPDRHG